MTSRVADLPGLVAKDAAEVRAQIAGYGLVDWDVLQPAAPPSASLIHDHEPVGITLVPRRLLSARLPIGAESPLWREGVTDVELSVGVHGVAAVLLWCSGRSLTDLEPIERAVCPHVPAVDL